MPKQLNVLIASELDRKLELYCVQNQVTKKDVITDLLENLLKTKAEG